MQTRRRSKQKERTTSVKSEKANAAERAALEWAQNPKKSKASSEEEEEEEEEPKQIQILFQRRLVSAAFFPDGELVLSYDGEMRYWSTEDGEEVGKPISDVEPLLGIAVSPDGKWIVGGTRRGHVVVWDALSREEVCQFKADEKLKAVDVSHVAIATTGRDCTVRIWSLSGQQLLAFKEHDESAQPIPILKFSPDGRLLATVVSPYFLRVYNTQDGRLLLNDQMYVWSLAWVGDSRRLFALSHFSRIQCVDFSAGMTLSEWSIKGDDEPICISLPSSGAFIAACGHSSISFWDTSTHEQICSLIPHSVPIFRLAISVNYDLAISGRDEITLRNLYDILPSRYIHYDKRRKIGSEGLREEQMRPTLAIAESEGESSKLDKKGIPSVELERVVEELRDQLTRSQRAAKQRKYTLEMTIKSLRKNIDTQVIQSRELEKTVQQHRINLENIHDRFKEVRTELVDSQTEVVDLMKILRSQCETLFANGYVIDAAKLLLEGTRCASNDAKADAIISDWLSSFRTKCIVELEKIGDNASGTTKRDEALAAYATAFSLGPSNSNPLLTKWTSTMLLHGSVNDALDGAHEFKLSRFTMYRTICDILEGGGQFTEAIMCLRQMQSEPTYDATANNELVQWERGFQRRCVKRLEELGDAALDSRRYDEAYKYFSAILSLDQPDHVETLIKRSKVLAMMESWEGALKDAARVIYLEPLSHRGYELKHAALHGAGRHADAAAAFEAMLMKLEKSPDAHVRELRSRYADARPAIRNIIRATISDMPRVLINTTTGHLLDRKRLAKVFEAFPIFDELVSYMTREIDHAWIQREVKGFYRYVMFSHKWDHGEPLFEQVTRVTVYKLEASRGNIKLQTFCSLARALGFRWAWSDTCCIDKESHVVLQESLVAMFAWYRGSSLTIVHLCDVSSQSDKPNGLRNSVWNTRVWTRQEYDAAERVLFYTQDWEPYLGLTLLNHKESPIILREMEVSPVSAERVAALHPGLDRVREKLFLASMREATLVEDIAYSMLGIFNARIPAIYGEGMRAVGRLLDYVLMGSGDATILAWTGTANEYNSCLPMDLTVYNPLIPPHIPCMETQELDCIVTKLCSSLPNLSLAVALYDQLSELPSATFASYRLQLPCIEFPITTLERHAKTDLYTYYATTDIIGDVEITTTSDLPTENKYCFVHPWIRPLLEQEHTRGTAGLDETTRALRLVARLKQRFGALMFEKVSRVEYRRVAADSLIMVQIRDEAPLTDLIDNITTIEVR